MSDYVTLSRELAERLGALLIRVNEQGPEYEGLIAALADPLPPAGGEPEVVRYIVNHSDRSEKMVLAAVFDEHVTRLQAEVERLQLQLETMTADRDAEKSMKAKARSQRDKMTSELTKARELLKEADNFMYIMTGHDSHARLVHQYGKEWWTPVNELRGKICTILSNQSAPADKGEPPNYKPGLYAVRHIDNWDGERDVVLAFAQLDAEGNWTEKETGEALLTYRGDKILNAWPLDFQAPAEQPAPVAVAPDFKMIGTEPMPPMEYDEP